MTIDKIFNNGDLSTRSYHACKYNGIETINDLKKYYERRKTFIYLRSCGEKSNLELIEILKIFNQKKINNNFGNFDDLQIKSINKYIKKKSELLSRRSLNAINIFFEMELVFDNFIKSNIFNLDLSTIENIGKKSITELNEYLYTIVNFIEDINSDNKTNLNVNENRKAFSYKVKSLNLLQRQVINRYIVNSTENLTVRSRNAITYYVDEPLKVTSYIEKIFNIDNFQVSRLNNIGKASIPELNTYLDNIKKFIIKVHEIVDEKELIRLNNRYLIQNIFSIENIPNEILESQSIVKLCDFLIKKDGFFKHDYNLIFHNTLDVFNTSCLSLNETASLTSLTRERVRQIRKKCFLDIPEKLKFLKIFEDDLYRNYEIDINENFIILENDNIKEINYLYNTNFSRNFINYILLIYISEDFTYIGNIEDVIIPKPFNVRKRHNWRNIYLIKKDIHNKIDLNQLCEDIDGRLSEKIKETYMFNFKSYLSRFLYNDNYKILELIKDDCEQIINDEFDILLDLDENIVFKRNTNKTASEYAFEALENLEKPSKISEIVVKMNELFPNYRTDEDKVRASLKRKDGFIPIGRKSVYGLKKWENELENFKGGTIRNIIREYLEKFTTPKHISDITDYVLQYRPKTNEHSILQNLKLDETKTFKFFINSHIGINGKDYNSNYTPINYKSIIRDWEESYDYLINFIKENNRLPYSNGLGDESKLYRWLNIQKNKLLIEKLSSQKSVLITNIVNQYSSQTRIRNNTIKNYDLLEKFIIKNKRLPFSIKEERKLYNFFRREHKKHIFYKAGDNMLTLLLNISKKKKIYENSRN